MLDISPDAINETAAVVKGEKEEAKLPKTIFNERIEIQASLQSPASRCLPLSRQTREISSSFLRPDMTPKLVVLKPSAGSREAVRPLFLCSKRPLSHQQEFSFLSLVMPLTRCRC